MLLTILRKRCMLQPTWNEQVTWRFSREARGSEKEDKHSRVKGRWQINVDYAVMWPGEASMSKFDGIPAWQRELERQQRLQRELDRMDMLRRAAGREEHLRREWERQNQIESEWRRQQQVEKHISLN